MHRICLCVCECTSACMLFIWAYVNHLKLFSTGGTQEVLAVRVAEHVES